MATSLFADPTLLSLGRRGLQRAIRRLPRTRAGLPNPHRTDSGSIASVKVSGSTVSSHVSWAYFTNRCWSLGDIYSQIFITYESIIKLLIAGVYSLYSDVVISASATICVFNVCS